MPVKRAKEGSQTEVLVKVKPRSTSELDRISILSGFVSFEISGFEVIACRKTSKVPLKDRCPTEVTQAQGLWLRNVPAASYLAQVQIRNASTAKRVNPTSRGIVSSQNGAQLDTMANSLLQLFDRSRWDHNRLSRR